MWVRWVLVSAVAVSFGLVAGESAAEAPVPYLYLTPTVGVWRWDEEIALGFEVPERTKPVVGLRAGYSPVTAFGGELVLLTGTNDLLREGTEETVGVRLSQLEFSLVVNFQSLVTETIYPFLNLGVGASVRNASGGEETSDADNSHFSFHLGGGLKWELHPRWVLRANIRDTFFAETQGSGNQERQVTVDSVELSVGFEMRFPLNRSGRRELQ